jgi:hypothetical protein
LKEKRGLSKKLSNPVKLLKVRLSPLMVPPQLVMPPVFQPMPLPPQPFQPLSPLFSRTLVPLT